MKTNIYKILIIAYSIILVWGFLKQVVSFYYHDLGYADMVWSLVPDDLVCPQYDIYTNEITNGVEEWEWNFLKSQKFRNSEIQNFRTSELQNL